MSLRLNQILGGADIRSPIFYDVNNTSYYIDPASTTNLNDLYLDGDLRMNGSDSYIWMPNNNSYSTGFYDPVTGLTPLQLSGPSDGIYIGNTMWISYNKANNNSYNENIRLFNANNSVSVIAFSSTGISGTPTTSILGYSDRFETRVSDQWQQRIYSGYVEAYGSFRAPIFYDSNNTGYYIDPASNSRVSQITTDTGTAIYLGNQNVSTSSRTIINWHSDADYNYLIGKRAGAWTQPMDIAFYTGIRYHAHQFYNAHIFYVTGYDSGEAFSIGKGDAHVRVVNNLYVPIVYDTNNTAYYVDPASTSVLNRLTIDGGNYANNYFQSLSDFTNGTLVTTDIPATAANGLSFVMNVVGKSYNTTTSPFNFSVQGYLYNSTIINYSGLSLDSTGLTTIKIFENGGFLCFWWARVSYWNAFEVSVRSYDTAKTNYNRVTNITDAVEPTGTKKVTVTMQTFLRADVSATNAVDLRSPIFYDSNNTAYYCDPTGTSNFTGLTVANTITGSISGNAGTATILQTARTINGTSFNGSANITTSSWGTARTLTIGSTGKSVDGSANISWSLAELGAAATNQTMFIGTTSVAINRASASQTLTGVSIDGNAATVTNGLTTTNYTSYTLPIGGSWYGVNLPGTRWNGMTVNGGEIVFGRDLPNNAQMGILVDGCYIAGENNGFWSLSSSNDWTTRRGMYWDGTYLNFTTNSAISIFTDARSTIFYDSNNTAYYLDPASTSNLNAITAAGNVTAAQYYTGGWFRNNGSGNGLYNESTGQHFYSDSANYWNVASSAGAQGIRLRTGGHNGTVRGYFYADTNNDVGFLNQDGSWRLRVVGGDYALADGSSMRAQIFYDSNDTSYYTNPASTSYLNYSIFNGLSSSDYTRQFAPSGGYFHAGGAQTGAIKIRMPANSKALYPMLSFTCHIYNYSTGTSRTFKIGGHFSSSSWYNTFAYCLSESAGNLNVRWGYEGNYLVVWIGETSSGWSYPCVFITDFQNGYSAINNSWMTGWNVSLVTAFDTVTNGPTAAGFFWNQNNDGVGSGLDADLLDGLQMHTGRNNEANKVVRTDSNGYIQAGWINTTSGDNGTTAIDRVYASSDGYIRYYTPANFRTVLDVPTRAGSGASGSWGISITGSSASCTGNAATATTTDNINGRAFYNRDSGNVLGQDSYTNNGVGYVNSVTLFGQTDGGIYTSAYSTSWVHQIFGDFRTGQIAVRGKNSGTWQSWRTILDSTNYTAYSSFQGTVYGTGFTSSTDSTYYLFPTNLSNLWTVRANNYYTNQVSVTSSASTTINTIYNVTQLTLSASVTTLTFSGIQSSTIAHMWTVVTLGQGTAYSITWPAAVKWPGGTAPTLTTTLNKRDIYQFITYDGGTTIFAIIVGQNL